MNAELIRVLQSLLDEAVESGLECGCQLAIYQDGELIADLAAGFTSPNRKNPVTPETLFPVFSVGKAIAVTAIHCLVEKGTLSYSTRLGDVWPEFDCNGKEHILLWHVLTHRAALFRDPEYAAPEEMADWQKMCGRNGLPEPAVNTIRTPLPGCWENPRRALTAGVFRKSSLPKSSGRCIWKMNFSSGRPARRTCASLRWIARASAIMNMIVS